MCSHSLILYNFSFFLNQSDFQNDFADKDVPSDVTSLEVRNTKSYFDAYFQ